MSQVPVLGPPTDATQSPAAALPRVCGRCRVPLADDPDLASVAQSGWSLCAPCRTALLPNHEKRVDAAERRQVRTRHAE